MFALGKDAELWADAILLAVERSAELKAMSAVAPRLQGQSFVWVVYPKGVTAIREVEVICGGGGAGLKDTKVVAFSKTHTGLRLSNSSARREGG